MPKFVALSEDERLELDRLQIELPLATQEVIDAIPVGRQYDPASIERLRRADQNLTNITRRIRLLLDEVR